MVCMSRYDFRKFTSRHAYIWGICMVYMSRYDFCKVISRHAHGCFARWERKCREAERGRMRKRATQWREREREGEREIENGREEERGQGFICFTAKLPKVKGGGLKVAKSQEGGDKFPKTKGGGTYHHQWREEEDARGETERNI